MSSIEDKLRALYARAIDPGSSEEEARTSAHLMCKLAKQHGRVLFVAPPPAQHIIEGVPLPRVLELLEEERQRAQSHLAQERRLARNRIAELETRAERAERRARVAAVDERRGLPYSWSQLGRILAAKKPKTLLELPKEQIDHPSSSGAEESIGWPRGQQSDWRFPPDPYCRGLHAQDFGPFWRVHLDSIHPRCDFLGHVLRDLL